MTNPRNTANRLTSLQISQIKNLHGNGHTELEIAKRIGCAKSTVSYHTPLRRSGALADLRRDRQMQKSQQAGAAVPRVNASGKKRRLTATPPGQAHKATEPKPRRLTATPPA